MKFGKHVSAAGGLENAPKNAAAIGAECFQFFSRSPRGGNPSPITSATAKLFKDECAKAGIEDYFIHAPYFINFASANNRIRFGSISVIREELERGSLLGAKYVMTHLGSAKDLGQEKAMTATVDGLVKVLDGYKGSTQFLIEISAGAGDVIGDTFEEIGEIIDRVEKTEKKNKVGVCFDTAHALASGYDFRTPAGAKKIFDDFDKFIGIERLKMSHINDSMVDLGAHKDRHEQIGEGYIGVEGFKALFTDKRLQDLCFALETPGEEADDKRNLEILKKLRDNR